MRLNAIVAQSNRLTLVTIGGKYITIRLGFTRQCVLHQRFHIQVAPSFLAPVSFISR